MPAASRTLVALLFLALATAPAAAQEDIDGSDAAADTGQENGPATLAVIEAVSYGTIPPGSRLVTQPETQGEMDDAAWRLVNEDLPARGYQIGSDGDLVLTVATQLVERLSTDQANTGPGPNSAVAEGMQFSTAQQTLLNPRQPVNRSDRVFRVAVSVYDRTSGGFVWRGSAERLDAETEPSAALRVMLPALLDHIGENASGVAVPLQP